MAAVGGRDGSVGGRDSSVVVGEMMQALWEDRRQQEAKQEKVADQPRCSDRPRKDLRVITLPIVLGMHCCAQRGV